MAVSRLWSVSYNLKAVIDYAENPEKTVNPKYTSSQYQALADVLAYAKDEEKTEREFFVEGINCNPSTARDQFVTVKEQYGKTGGVQAYHGYLSFKEMDITPEKAQEVGMEFANRVWGKRFQVVVTTHLNTEHLHCHFVINSVSFVDGLKLANEEKAWFKFHHIADEICKSHGLHYIKDPKRNKQPSYYYNLEKAGMPTPYQNLRETLDYAISRSRSVAELTYALKDLGYDCQFQESRRYWTIVPKGRKKPVRLYHLGENYTNEAIRKRLKENNMSVHFEPFQKTTYRPRQYKLLTREQRIKKVGGLYGLYLYYCYSFGALPKYKKQNIARLHALLKEDLIKLDQFTEQVTFLGKNQINTSEELFSFKHSCEEKIKNLVADRTHLRNKIRTKIDDAELSKAKQEISEITGKLQTLRKEVRLCDRIAERSKLIEKKLEVIQSDEEKLRRKENRSYVQRR